MKTAKRFIAFVILTFTLVGTLALPVASLRGPCCSNVTDMTLESNGILGLCGHRYKTYSVRCLSHGNFTHNVYDCPQGTPCRRY